MKKWLSVILSILLSLSVVPVMIPASAFSEDIVDHIESETYEISLIEDYNGHWEPSYDEYGEIIGKWFRYEPNIETLTIYYTDPEKEPFTGDFEALRQEFGSYPEFYSDQSAENQ